MVKQYKDGYFLNGKWHSGQFDNSEIIERNKVIADKFYGFEPYFYVPAKIPSGI